MGCWRPDPTFFGKPACSKKFWMDCSWFFMRRVLESSVVLWIALDFYHPIYFLTKNILSSFFSVNDWTVTTFSNNTRAVHFFSNDNFTFIGLYCIYAKWSAITIICFLLLDNFCFQVFRAVFSAIHGRAWIKTADGQISCSNAKPCCDSLIARTENRLISSRRRILHFFTWRHRSFRFYTCTDVRHVPESAVYIKKQ